MSGRPTATQKKTKTKTKTPSGARPAPPASRVPPRATARAAAVAIASEAAMRRFGACLGRRLQPGDFVGLIGDLGAGKTVLTRGIAEGAGVPASQVASPTFAIVYPYRGARIALHHADLYRVADEEELFATGFFDLLGQGAMVVEWIDRVPEALPAQRLVIRIERTGERRRRLALEAEGERHRALAAEVVEEFRAASGRRARRGSPG